ncbi:MAG: PilX N-terminal domain-containing pilus assembly protein [Gammaproteobacteria bacterium]|jgi:hypothetical protein
MQSAVRSRRAQQGVVTLLVALVLMTALTVVTLSVAHTQLVEQRVAGNQQWQTRLFLLAEAGLAEGVRLLEKSALRLDWRDRGTRRDILDRRELSNGVGDIKTQLMLRRPKPDSAYVLLQSTSERDDGSGLQVGVSEFVRPLSVLSPAGENAPPLVLNGCLVPPAAGLDIRPLNADLDQAGDAIWLSREARCPRLSGIDAHRGNTIERALGEDLWPTVFSVDREAFTAMAAAQEHFPEPDRIYRTARAEDLVAGRWLRSLGTPQRPVALYFPSDLGCPEFAPGVRLYGVVFIEAGCTRPVSTHSFELYGSLVVNGNLSVGGSELRLSHVQVADARQKRLRFPVLRSVAVPGSWSDF